MHLKHSPQPNLAITKWWEIIPPEQYSAVLEELFKTILVDDKSDALYIDREVTEYSDQQADSETDVEDSPVHKTTRT
ncbi:hypothetical protein AVEN_235497-1 [Araneus ventricosus]|uniref:Uncharacterized protein n=1 Tax=Araneus ventricosus TaxID=182803 RepID=A0A4Y2A5R6_ARAVE|nr:hypothetical protein AVEN_235497-1 [Araneus ventricosus]